MFLLWPTLLFFYVLQAVNLRVYHNANMYVYHIAVHARRESSTFAFYLLSFFSFHIFYLFTTCNLLCRIYTFAWVARRITSIPIIYLPRHSPHHSWRSLWKQFFEHKSEGTNSDLRYVYEHVNVRTHVKTVFLHWDRGIRMFLREARHDHECVNAVL